MYVGYKYKVKNIVKIYDGDTITVELDLGFHTTRTESLRLSRINAPEIRGDEREEGLKSRDWLRATLYTAMKEGKEVVVETFKDKKGKYGRYIAEVYIDGSNVNSQLVTEGLAVFKEY